jgi:predicted nucleotidyltransferase
MRMQHLSPAIAVALADAKARLQARFGARLVELRLYGSVARGTANEDSDVDVLVVLDHIANHMERSDAAGDVGEAGMDHLLPLEALVLDVQELEFLRRTETLLAANLDRDGVTL